MNKQKKGQFRLLFTENGPYRRNILHTWHLHWKSWLHSARLSKFPSCALQDWELVVPHVVAITQRSTHTNEEHLTRCGETSCVEESPQSARGA